MTDTTGHDILDVDVGPDDPATDVPVETLRSGLQSDDSGVRLHAANVASFVPREEIETLTAVVPELLECLHDDSAVVVYQAAIALGFVAEQEPETLEDGIPRLVELLEADHSLTQAMAAQALGYVVMNNPELFVNEVDDLVTAALETPEDAVDQETLQSPDLDRNDRRILDQIQSNEMERQQYARNATLNLLVELADHDPSVVSPYVDDLTALLEAENVALRTAMADLVAKVAKSDPTAVDDTVDRLCANLEHSHESLVATAITALGFIGNRAAVTPLEELADDENRSTDLRELAAETADFIDTEAGQ